MKTAEELWGLLEEAQHLPYGSAQIALVEQVLRHVDPVDDPALRFYARLYATTAYIYGGEPVKAFATFSWCVADFDRNPGPYHQRWTHNLLWLFKNMVSSLTKFPEVPLERTHAILDDMERRYRETGHGMQPVYKHRYLVARHVGQTAEAQSWFEKWQAAPRNSLSDCAGCDPTSLVRHLADQGRHAEAVELAEPVLAGDLSCSEQPQSILSELMVVYLKTGRLSEAADAHRRSYLIERNNLADLGGIGDHIAFCARTGNEHRGLEILQRHIDWLDRAPSPAAAMSFAAAGALLLRRITELGHGDSPVRRTGRDDTPAAELAEELAKQATELAARFDARNGTRHQSTVIAEQLAAEPYGVQLQLSPTARRAPVAPAAQPAVEVVAAPPVETPAGASAGELIELAEQCRDEDREDAMRAVLEQFETRFETPADPVLAARLWVLRGVALPYEDHHGTVAAWERAIELYDLAGEAGKASSLRARVALQRAQADAADEDLLAVVRADAAYQDEHGDAAARASAWLRLAHMNRMLGRLDEANEAGDRGDRNAEEDGDPRRLAHHAMLRAQHRAMTHRHEEAAEAARAAWHFFREHGPARASAEAAVVYGQVAHDPAEVAAAMSEAIAVGLDGPAFVARVRRGRALMQLDRAEEAIDDLVEAVALGAEQGLEPGGLFARQELAQAYRLAGRPAEAAEVAEEALAGFERLGFDEPADDTRFLLAGVYREIGDSTRALGIYHDLIARLTDNPAGRGQIGEQAGDLLYQLDRDAEAALAFRAAAEALREAGDLAGELRVLRRRLMALHYADQEAEAEEVIRLAGERYAQLPAELAAEPAVLWGRSIFAFEVGNFLMRRGRYAEALPHLTGAAERLRGIGATDDADRLEGMYAEALLRSGAPTEAVAILRALLDRMGPQAPTRDVVERVLADALEMLREG